MDFQKLQEKLNPKPDGESPVRHRSGVVDAVNADGTVDLDLGGTVVPDVSVLEGAVVEVGDTVQVAVWAGDLLVIGRNRTDLAAVGAVGTPAIVTSNQTGIGTSQTDLTGLVVTFTAIDGRRYEVTASLQFARTANTPAFCLAQIKDNSGSPVYQEMIVETPSTAYSLTVQRGVILECPADIAAGSHTIKTSAAAATGAGNTVALSATSTRPAWVLAEDIGAA